MGGGGGRAANFILLRPNYSIFIGYLKKGAGKGCSSEPLEHPLIPPLF